MSVVVFFIASVSDCNGTGWRWWVDLLRTGLSVAEVSNGLSPAVELVKSPKSILKVLKLPRSIAETEKAAWSRSASYSTRISGGGRVVQVTLLCDLHHAVAGQQKSEKGSVFAKIDLWRGDRPMPIGDESLGSVTGITRVK
jgi:hypothetical protein